MQEGIGENRRKAINITVCVPNSVSHGWKKCSYGSGPDGEKKGT